MKLLVSESEKNRILGMHNKVRKMLFEAMAEDVANWAEAKTWIAGQSGGEEGVWPTASPDYRYAKFKNYGNWLEIQNNGNAMEHKNDGGASIHSGTWSWNGSKVIFSWMRPEVSGWEEAKEHFKTTNASDYKTGYTYDAQGIWNVYEWARAKLNADNNVTLEIKSDGTYKTKYFSSNNTDRAGKWSWDGSKIIFDLKSGMTKRASGYFTEDDGPADNEGLKVAVFEKNKIGNIGAKGPVVKFIQHIVTEVSDEYINDDNIDVNIGTGAGCGHDIEKCDGIYGPKTKELVKKYQKQDYMSVTPDGIWGKETTRMELDAGEDLEDKVD
jgi:hypothetical protein